MLTRSEIRCKKPAFLAIFRLKYCILCPFWTKIIVFELKRPIYDAKIQQNQISFEFKP